MKQMMTKTVSLWKEKARTQRDDECEKGRLSFARLFFLGRSKILPSPVSNQVCAGDKTRELRRSSSPLLFAGGD